MRQPFFPLPPYKMKRICLILIEFTILMHINDNNETITLEKVVFNRLFLQWYEVKVYQYASAIFSHKNFMKQQKYIFFFTIVVKCDLHCNAI